MRTAEEIKRQLAAPDFRSIEVWRASPGAPTAVQAAVPHVREAADGHEYAARFGPKALLVSSFEYERLLRAGAIDVGHGPLPHG